MRAWQYPNLAADLTQILIAAAIHSLLFFQDADAKGFFLDVIEGLRNGELVRLGIFLEHRCLYFLAQRLHRLGASNFTLSIECALNALAGDLIREFKQLRFDVQWGPASFGLASLCRTSFLCANHVARVSVREFQC